MTREEQIQKLDSMAKPRSEEAIRKAEERKKQREGELYKIAMRYAQDELKDNHASVEKIVAAAFLDGIDYAEHHQHWINVKDELPKEHGAYLVLNRVSNTQDIYVWSNGEWRYNAFKCPSWVITHWMPMPEPPSSSGKPNNCKEGDQQ